MTRLLWDEPIVIIPGRLAGPLCKLLGEGLAAARREGREGLGEFEDLARDLMAASLAAARTDPPSDVGRTQIPSPSAGEVLVVEAASVLGLSARRIRQLLDAGQLTGRWAGGARLVDVASVEALRQRRSS